MSFPVDPSTIDATAVQLMLKHVPPHFWIYLGLAALERWTPDWMDLGYLLVALLALSGLAG